MWCMICNNDLSNCICPDINERLQRAANSGNVAYHKCIKCNKHYNTCKCDVPELVIERGKNNINSN